MTREISSARTHLRGVLLVVIAFCVLPATDGVAKFLIGDYHVVQLVWVRLFFQSIVVVAWLTASRQLKLIFPKRPKLLVGTVSVIWLANFPIIFSLAFLPLADAFALAMTAPLLVMVLSAIYLREKVDAHRWGAVAIGFCGALVIIRPGLGLFHWAAILPVLAATLFALYQIGVRVLTVSHTPVELLFYASVLPLLGSTLWVAFFWITPDGFSWGLMALMGSGAALGHFLLIAALNYAPASLLAPFMYLQLLSSTVFGLLVFGDFPDVLTIVGAGVIAASGVYAMRRV